ncbi:hypothetical protein LTR05_006811 [Lithohypha guttulata]|uniref:Uncharacterized protein n=1 Tax=Lithohypha guttulata TaxID=1690604 RepID=A0AAN7Y9F1_9EURO|nr:hypothetical protein LTR05_006811 [Lithohypha guttulata]
MVEEAGFQPMLLVTGDGPAAGMQELFPASDNEKKLQRSCDNAETVGLYHPTSTNSAQSNTVAPAVTTVPPPKTQRAGGAYSLPANGRKAIALSQAKHDPSLSSSSRTSLYAPREGQAHRERLLRQQSTFDRGTLFAQNEVALREPRTTQASSTINDARVPTGALPAQHYAGFARVSERFAAADAGALGQSFWRHG